MLKPKEPKSDEKVYTNLQTESFKFLKKLFPHKHLKTDHTSHNFW